jgi:hypothetical protein
MSLDIDLIETSPHSVFDANITHNLNKMADAAGIYEALWHPERTTIKKASELAAVLLPAIADMKARPDFYKQFDAENGWGTYREFIPWLDRLYDACIEHPDASIQVSV